MRLAFQYRLYPFPEQLEILARHRSELTYLWNYAVAQRRDAWQREHRSISYLDQQRDLTRWRAYDREGLDRLSTVVAQDCLQRVDLAYRAFYRRVHEGRRPGYPRFRRTVDSFTYTPNPTRSPLRPGRNGTWGLKFPRAGEIPLRLHRPLPNGATVRTVTVKHEAGAWYATLCAEIADPPPPPSTPPAHPVGIDLGLTALATLSNGEVVNPPRFFQDAERRLAREQRRLARKRRGSRRYERQRLRVARCHAKVRRRRRGFAHELSHEWAERFDLVAFEDLDAAELREGNPLAKGMTDRGWGMLRDLTRYKLALRSRRYQEVAARGTTQTCSRCGRVADPPLPLTQRTYRCPCGSVLDRDQNAARNVRARGLTLLKEMEKVRRNTTELTRTESGPPPRRVGRRAYQRRGAGSKRCEGAEDRSHVSGSVDRGEGEDPPSGPT